MKRYFVQTFGCQMNVHDSRRIEEVLHQEGYIPARFAAEADLIVVNTCSVREKAEHKLMSYLGRLRECKEARPGTKLFVAGCVAQQEGHALLKRAPFIDAVLGPDNAVELPELLQRMEESSLPQVRTHFDQQNPTFLQARPRVGEVSAFVTVMKGCDERCTFCVVPYTRGPERYRPAQQIIDEISALVAGGVREITLLGQTVNSWYEPGSEKSLRRGPSTSQFAALLARIEAEVPMLARLRYTAPHPRHLTPELIAVHRESKILARHMHLPLQSGSDRMLRRMSRRYTASEYFEGLSALRKSCPDISISTDLIVGFCGETEEDFQATLQAVRQARYSAAFCFKYSPRPQTSALNLEDDVSEQEKEIRLARLLEVVDAQQAQHLQSLVGTYQQVLITETGDGANLSLSGRNQHNDIVHIAWPLETNPIGQIVEVICAQAFDHSIAAVLPTHYRPRHRLNALHAGQIYP